MSERKARNSSFELLRIISMFLIIVDHILGSRGHVIENSTGALYYFLLFFRILCLVHVNSYILVTGYYQSRSKFNIKKIINILLSSWFYRILVIVIFISFGIMNFTKMDILQNLLIFTGTGTFYWFIVCYIVLYFFTPFLNKCIKDLSKKQYLMFLLSYFLIFSVLASINGYNAFGINRGFSVVNFIFLYFIGAYFKKYPLEKTNINFFKIKKAVKYFMIFITFALLTVNFLLYVFGEILNSYGGGIGLIGHKIMAPVFCYDNPLVIIASIAYFLIFYNMTFKSKFINFIARNVFDVYLIHENYIIRSFIYPFIGFGFRLYNSAVILKIFIVTFAIFIICNFIGCVKNLIFKLISKLKICKKFDSYFSNINNFYNKTFD